MLKNSHKQFLGMGLLALMVSGCSTMPMSSSPPAVEHRAPQESSGTSVTPSQPSSTTQSGTPPATVQAVPVPVTPTEIAVKPQSPAVLALLNDAEQKQQQGDMASAQVTLQRAQRIAPRDPAVYYALAETHLHLKDYGLAEQVALKGVSLVQGQPNELKKFWNLIATIRLQSGNAKGADLAKRQADRY